MDFFKKKKEKKEKKDKKSKKEKEEQGEGGGEQFKLLVIDSDEHDWYSIFKNVKCSNGNTIQVEKTRWYAVNPNPKKEEEEEKKRENMMISSSGAKPQIYLKPNQNPIPGTNEKSSRQFDPDLVLIRKLVRGLCSDEDYRNILFGLMYSNIPCINTAHSVYMNLDRPVVHAALSGIKREHGDAKYPLIAQTPEFPIVIKVGHAEAGYGKMRFTNPDEFKDFRGVLALHKDYATIEGFVENREYDLRIQKIGNHYRAYKRIASNWKGNVGSSVIEEIPMTDEFLFWAEESGRLFGGMEILTVDAIRANERHYIIEINDTASGLYGPNEKVDMGYISELVVQKLNQHYCSPSHPLTSSSSTTTPSSPAQGPTPLSASTSPLNASTPSSPSPSSPQSTSSPSK